MKLESITVENYRQFEKAELAFDEGITILAGANNSGKTSLINLIKNIFVDDKLNYNMSDIPAKNMREWVEWVYPIFQKFFRDGKTEENVEKDLLNVVIPKEETDPTHLMKMTTVKIHVSYNPDIDDIKLFADCIMDLDETKHDFYFMYNFEIVHTRFAREIINNFSKIKHRFAEIDEKKSQYAETADELIINNIQVTPTVEHLYSWKETRKNIIEDLIYVCFQTKDDNDLITFTKLAVDRFPIIKKKISDKYQLIFIDEYQDTSADVLHIFYTSLVGKKSKLYLLGDKMQQIYKNYNGEFEEKLETFNRSVNLSINYRTTPKIVDILNYIYNDEALKQYPYEKNSNNTMAFSPKVLIVNDVEKAVIDFRKSYEDALFLYVSNRARFYDIGAGNLYDAYNKMEKYQFWKKYSAVDVMTKDEARINDALLSFLFIVDQIIEYYLQECYGEVFKNIHEYYMYFNSEKYIVKKHRDKKAIKTRLEKIKNSYVDRATTIDGFLNICFKEELIEEEIYCSIIEDDDYQLVKDVYIEEVRKLTNYLNDPKVSTQHGVKGESHDTVVFVADDSNNPAVHMSKFFEMWSDMNITLREFDAFYYRYSNMIKDIERTMGIKISELRAKSYAAVADMIDTVLKRFISENETNPYYISLLKPKMEEYKKNVTSAKACLNEAAVYGPLCAYRLFYVGCSRARKNLLVIINKNDIKTFEDELCEKLKDCGFEVEY